MPGQRQFSNEFFDERREWSAWKHQLLHRYLGAFAGILGWRHKLIHYIDGFAGAGAYGTGATREEGSPLIAARLAQDAQVHQRYELRCINVEPDAANFENLVEATAPFGSPTVTNLRGPFAEHLPSIIRSVGLGPALFFLDPFGYRGMEWGVMHQIAERQLTASTAKTEVLINFNIGRIDRDAGWLDSLEHKARDAFVEHITDLMGTEDWMPIVERGLPKAERHQQLLVLYASRLANLFRGTVGTYPVRRLQGEIKYHLLHVTAHPMGMLAMSDAIARVDGEYAQAQFAWKRHSSLQMSFAMLDPDPTQAELDAVLAGELAAAIYSMCQQQKTMTFQQIQLLVTATDEWFGRATERIYRAACKILIQQGRIARASGAGIKDHEILTFV